MIAKDLAAFYGRVALVVLVFAFVTAIVAGPLLQKAGFRQSTMAAVEDQARPELLRAKMTSVSENKTKTPSGL